MADPLVALGVAGAGAVGAGLRMAFTRWADRTRRPLFPWPILAVNVAGSALLGVLAALAGAGRLSPGGLAVLGAGLCGGLTTYSTFAVDAVALGRARRWGYLALHLVASVLGAVVAARLGSVLAT